MYTNDAKREFIESLRTRLGAEKFMNLLGCLKPDLGYESELMAYRARSISPERIALWAQESAELRERLAVREPEEGSWCDPFITRRPPPRRPDLDVDAVTDLLKYVYATVSRAIAELQYQLAELTGTGRLDPEANEYLQWDWCFRSYEFLCNNTVGAVRNEHTSDDWDWVSLDNTYSTGHQVMSRVQIDPDETAERFWQYNEYLCGDGPIEEYPRGAIFHIADPPSCCRNRDARR